MDYIDVYVMNIQPREIAKRILCGIDDKEAIEEERNNFRKFLLELKKLGKEFRSQLDAWNSYNFEHLVNSFFSSPSIPMFDNSELVWEKEVISIAYDEANTINNLANYDENKAQK